ncbi:MAG TPA: hypothetical protein VFI91_12635 [Longimicrobiaceae bacterium]|nr:hypothetical protein [Longimicrobiaceae bacterium]
MKLQSFYGRDVPGVAADARAALGDDAMIVRTRVLRSNDTSRVEVVAASASELHMFRERLEGRPLPMPLRAPDGRPFVLALVGPAGAGKTTALARLALNARGFGDHSVGVITLDTFRMGAIEQTEEICETADLPLQIAYEADDVVTAIERLRKRDVILIDTPGRAPEDENWIELLRAGAPDEVHLVIPATVRSDVAIAAHATFRATEPTHQLLTCLDQVPGGEGVAELAADIDLPARWVTDGYTIPGDLATAPERLLSALTRTVAA